MMILVERSLELLFGEGRSRSKKQAVGHSKGSLLLQDLDLLKNPRKNKKRPFSKAKNKKSP